MDLITLATSLEPNRGATFTSTLVIAGLVVVLGTLAILIFVFNVFGKSVSKAQHPKNKKIGKKAIMEKDENVSIPLAQGAIAAASAQSSVPVAQPAISGEVVAAISAAVYMLEGENAVVKSITPIRKNPITSRNPWAMAAVIENTRSF